MGGRPYQLIELRTMSRTVFSGGPFYIAEKLTRIRFTILGQMPSKNDMIAIGHNFEREKKP